MGWTGAEADVDASRSTGIGGGMTLGRRSSATGLVAGGGWMMLRPRCLGDVDGEAEGEEGVLTLSDRTLEPVMTLTLAFLPFAECQALQ